MAIGATIGGLSEENMYRTKEINDLRAHVDSEMTKIHSEISAAKSDNMKLKTENKRLEELIDHTNCVICTVNVPDIFLPCKHIPYCHSCLKKNFNNVNSMECPICRESCDIESCLRCFPLGK